MPVDPAFGPGSYPDHRSDDQRNAERAAVEAQLEGLKKMSGNSERQRTVIGRLQDRRRSRPRRVQIEPIRRDDGPDLLVAAGSVVTRHPRMDALLYKTLNADFRTTPHIVTQLDVARPANSTDTMPDVVKKLSDSGADVELNYVLPLAGHIKGGGGPEPSAGQRQFGEVWFERRRPSPVVAVLDTGISAERRADDYLAMQVDSEDIDPLDELGRPGYLDAAAGHGAFVTGIIQQVAPTTDVRIYKAVDSDGITTDTALATMMRTAVAEGATILNLSLGSETVDGKAPRAVADFVQQNPDVLVVCAAGNGGDGNAVWPAALAGTSDNVVSVAALDPGGDPAGWSTHREGVTCSAIGQGVFSTYVVGKEDGALVGDPHPDEYGENSWAVWTGTSFATPQITGAVARIMMESDIPLTPREALDVLLTQRPHVDLTREGYGIGVKILPGT